MKTLVVRAVCILIPTILGLTACSETREEEIVEAVDAPADYPPEMEAIVSEPDGQLGVPTDGEPTADSGVVNPPDMAESGKPAFAELDQNDDGYLQENEIDGREQLKEQWEELDSNNDQQLDSAEFAKFETQ